MVYTVFYAASEAITRAIVYLILAIYERLETRKKRETKPKEVEKKMPGWGWFRLQHELGSDLVYVGRHTGVRIIVPEPPGGNLPHVRAYNVPPPTRLYFTFSEAASPQWFREIEWLAEQAEKRRRAR